MSYRNFHGLGAEDDTCKKAGEKFAAAMAVASYSSSNAIRETTEKIVSQCCTEFKKTGSTQGMLECFGRASTAAGAAAACVASVVLSPFAGVCGAAGAFIADRVMGFDQTQLGVGVAAGVVCGIASGGTASAFCFYVGGEIAGWASDTLGPIIDGIFNPGKAKERELAARRARDELLKNTTEGRRAADEQYRLIWSDAIRSIKQTYQSLFNTPVLSARAKQILGFGPIYDDIAKAFAAAGAATTPTHWSPFREFLDNQKKSGGPGCAVNDLAPWDPYSEVCPFMAQYFYDTMARAALASGQLGTRDQQIAFEQRTATQLGAILGTFYSSTMQAISSVVTRVTIAAFLMKQQDAEAAARSATRAQLAAKAASAASIAEAAADEALHGNTKQSQAAVERAKIRYNQAVAAYNLILDSLGPRGSSGQASVVAQLCRADASCQKATNAVVRAKNAADLAVKNAATATATRYLVGASVAAGTAGLIYYLWLR